ncbi:DUF4386 domain-containing protein [Mangrovibacterium marinum]|uniref:Uncharacterized protein DUF4386 n=1 Tax=Mangrovibacterium marinum TaxID=1639118 RepID=A0A2T5C166_9BACT|nr:DUF4386 domain-containing protein [Mangrovibacterium marinum]PTN08368.1 uncharacterized protein DUF4386 [Mangrovibacterium marinum]
MSLRTLSKLAGTSYIVIFAAAVFANFFALESIIQNPLNAVQHEQLIIRLGIMAFLLTVAFDVVVAWALYKLYETHPLGALSSLFRMMHAVIMGVATFALPMVLNLTTTEAILKQINIFNTIWLIGLFFFGIHLILLAKILSKPRFITVFLAIAGAMYMIDTTAHFTMDDYDKFRIAFLTFVAVPSILGEMSLSVWLLAKGGKAKPNP